MSRALPNTVARGDDASSPHACRAIALQHEVATALLRQAVLAIDTQLRRRLRTQGLTHTQWRALSVLESVNALPASEMAKRLDMDTGAATRLLDRLETKGLCRRRRSLVDRRVVHIALSEEGARAFAATCDSVAEAIAECFADITTHELTALQDVLTRIGGRCTTGTHCGR